MTFSNDAGDDGSMLARHLPMKIWDPSDEVMVDSYVRTQIKDTTKWDRAQQGLLAQHTIARYIEERLPGLAGKLWSQSVQNMWHPSRRFDHFDFLNIDVKSTPATDISLDQACARLKLSVSKKHVDDAARPDDLILLQVVHSLRYRATVALCCATMKDVRELGQTNPSVPEQVLLDKRDAHSFEELIERLQCSA